MIQPNGKKIHNKHYRVNLGETNNANYQRNSVVNVKYCKAEANIEENRKEYLVASFNIEIMQSM